MQKYAVKLLSVFSRFIENISICYYFENLRKIKKCCLVFGYLFSDNKSIGILI